LIEIFWMPAEQSIDFFYVLGHGGVALKPVKRQNDLFEKSFNFGTARLVHG
jgi:hypothetical protein